MKSNIFNRYRKMHYASDYYGAGKSSPTNIRCRRSNKKKAKLQMQKDFA